MAIVNIINVIAPVHISIVCHHLISAGTVIILSLVIVLVIVRSCNCRDCFILSDKNCTSNCHSLPGNGVNCTPGTLALSLPSAISNFRISTLPALSHSNRALTIALSLCVTTVVSRRVTYSVVSLTVSVINGRLLAQLIQHRATVAHITAVSHLQRFP